MVQYIITPWRNRHELLNVRKAFYPSPEVSKDISDQRHEAVELVSVWVQRGNCPHSVESTALLVSAMLNDVVGTSAYAKRAAYSTAFSRFVTGLLDGYQDKRHKLSMYSIAKNIGLPATFVELRHQCTHEELPSLAKLRAAAERSLLWIWDHYWETLEESAASGEAAGRRVVLLEYLQWRTNSQSQEQDPKPGFMEQLRKWDKDQLLEALMEFNDINTTEPRILRQALRLSRAILSGKEKSIVLEAFIDDERAPGKEIISLEEIRADIAKAEIALQEDEGEEDDFPEPAKDKQDEKMREEDDDGEVTGWQMWKGPWIPKPIGVI